MGITEKLGDILGSKVRTDSDGYEKEGTLKEEMKQNTSEQLSQ